MEIFSFITKYIYQIGTAILLFLCICFFFLSLDTQLFTLFFFIPVLFGVFLRGLMIGVTISIEIERLIYTFLTTLFLMFTFYLQMKFDNESFGFDTYAIIFQILSIVFFCIFAGNEKGYITLISIEYFFIQSLLFVYFFGGIQVLLYTTPLILFLVLSFNIYKSQRIELFLSILSSFLSMVFWGFYIYTIIISLFDESIFGYFSYKLIESAGEFILLGMSLGFMLQNLFMFMVYISPRDWYYNEEDRKAIQKMNKLFLERFENKYISFIPTIIILSCILGSILLYNIFPVVSKELFVGIIFLVSSLIFAMQSKLSVS